MSGRALGDVLLLIPCCGSKKGDGLRPQVRSAPLGTELSGASVRLLEEGRRRAFSVKRDALQPGSPLLPATVWYTGNPYKVPGFRAALDSAFQRGLRCLIVSAGYGLLRPDDPIHKYNLRMAETLPIWKRRLPDILADYISRKGVTRVFGALSAKYFEAVVDVQGRASNAKFRWYVPQFDPRAGGAPVTQISVAVGQAVISLVRSDFNPDECREIAPAKNLAAPASPSARFKGTYVASSRPALAGEKRAPGSAPRKPDFEATLAEAFTQAERAGQPHIDIQAGELHRDVGGYPGSNHRMPTCCGAMREAMQDGRDEILKEPEGGKGASLRIRYQLPRFGGDDGEGKSGE